MSPSGLGRECQVPLWSSDLRIAGDNRPQGSDVSIDPDGESARCDWHGASNLEHA
jgi:hypothetical protein